MTGNRFARATQILCGCLFWLACQGALAQPAQLPVEQPDVSNTYPLPQRPGTAPIGSAKIAIIMDDIGNNLPLGQRAVELPGAITYAVLPHTPLAVRLSRYAVGTGQGKEIIVHMPMQSSLGNRLGPGGLVDDFDRDKFLQTLREALAQVPHATGLSNHMGSYLTTLPDRMQWLMAELHQHGWFYIDSKTTSGGKAQDAASDSRVPYIARDIFLDHDPSPEAIRSAFVRAKQLARANGVAVIIAHPYRTTLAFLEQHLPRLADQGFTLVNASSAIDFRDRSTRIARQ